MRCTVWSVRRRTDGIFLRLVGGLAVKVHCERAVHRALRRDYPDIDFVTDKSGALRLEAFLKGMGYTPNKTFNTLSGDRRQLYYDDGAEPADRYLYRRLPACATNCPCQTGCMSSR